MPTSDSSYHGPERRRHRLYLTRNTEYHFRDDVCVAVRDRKTGRWLESHLAVSRRLTAAVRFRSNGSPAPSIASPGVGEALYFGNGGQELLTTALSGVDRPGKDIVESYPA
jgi:hypothetical protein